MKLTDLVGTWRGRGEGSYPTIEPFTFEETVTIEPVAGKPFLRYEQRTINLGTGEPSHTELGFLRPLDDGAVEAIIAQPTGVTETLVGRIDGSTLAMRAATVATTPTAKQVTATARTFVLDGATLTIELSMAAVGRDLTHHLRSTLTRDP